MKTCVYSTVVVVCLLALSTSAEGNLQNTDRENKRFEKKNFDRTSSKKHGRPMGPHGEDRRVGQSRPFLMAGDPRFEQMLKLALVDKEKLSEAIENWPRTQQMSENEKRKFVRRVTMFREKLRKEAMEEARQLELEISEDQKVEYFRSYWTARMQLEQEIREQAKERHETKMKALREQLQQKWLGG